MCVCVRRDTVKDDFDVDVDATLVKIQVAHSEAIMCINLLIWSSDTKPAVGISLTCR